MGRRPFLLANPGSFAHEDGVYPRVLAQPVTWSSQNDWEADSLQSNNVSIDNNIQLTSPGFSETFSDGQLGPEYSFPYEGTWSESGGGLSLYNTAVARPSSQAYGWWEWEMNGHYRYASVWPIVTKIGTSRPLYAFNDSYADTDTDGYVIELTYDEGGRYGGATLEAWENGERVNWMANVDMDQYGTEGTLRLERDQSNTFTLSYESSDGDVIDEATATGTTHQTSNYQIVEEGGEYPDSSRTWDFYRWESSGNGYANSGAITLSHEFKSPVAPALSTNYSLNGGSIDLTITGSPSGNSEVKTVSLDGSTTYNLGWNNGHAEYQVAADLSASSDGSSTPVLEGVTLSP